MKNQLKNATVIILVASTYIYSSLAAELSWPQAEVGASESGFSESGMEQLDKAMRQIVANQDVAGMVWMFRWQHDVCRLGALVNLCIEISSGDVNCRDLGSPL